VGEGDTGASLLVAYKRGGGERRDRPDTSGPSHHKGEGKARSELFF